MNTFQHRFLVLLLACTGLAVFAYKVHVLGFPLSPDETSPLWKVEAHVAFEGTGQPVKVRLQTLDRVPGFVVTDEHYIGGNFGLHTTEENGNAAAIWSRRRAAGKQDIFYYATLRPDPNWTWQPSTESPTLTDPGFTESELKAADTLLSEAGMQSADLETFVPLLMKALLHPGSDPNAAYLLRETDSRLDAVNMAVRVLHLAGIPAQAVHGIDLETISGASIRHWLEIHDGSTWRMFDVANDRFSTPKHFVPWWRGDASLLSTMGARKATVRLSVVKDSMSSLGDVRNRLSATGNALLEYSLLGLPVQAQAMYHMLLLIPVGALLLVFLRNVIGFSTFGTFMPVLIALSFRETELVWGLSLFSLVIVLGLAVRLYLEHLKLLLVPRLASVLIVVVLLMAGISIITYKLGMPRGVSVSLFPMVILSMTIERISVMWDELGALAAIKQALGSLGVAVLAYLVMVNDLVGHLVFVFPELFLVLLALTLLLGRYTGYRLMDLVRFRAFLTR
ncbi:inactive transglutaminase family protein [Desulfobaculum sp. SPO524]|uniref:inactive transglutaminase family protein n=1 Tax=Desulfobaculum sp. SPO524 TaxID=3378071 RepID=UPI0038521CEE